MACIELVRFEAPLADCQATATAILQQHHKPAALRPFTAAEHGQVVADPSPLNVPWYQPQAIRNGLIGGARDSHKPVVFIDTDRGVFYYQYTD